MTPGSNEDSPMTNETRDMNRDPITGAPGSHPLGTGVGATGGAVAGQLERGAVIHRGTHDG